MRNILGERCLHQIEEHAGGGHDFEPAPAPPVASLQELMALVEDYANTCVQEALSNAADDWYANFLTNHKSVKDTWNAVASALLVLGAKP